MTQRETGKMYIHGGLSNSYTAPQGVIRPYGMTKWIDGNKMDIGINLLYIIHNDIYIDIQNEHYGKEDSIESSCYIKIGPWFVLAMEIENNTILQFDYINLDLYIRIPRILYNIIGPLLEKKYVKIRNAEIAMPLPDFNDDDNDD